MTQTGGPGLGGVLVQLAGAPGAIFVDIASYLASAWLLCGLARPAGVHAQQRGAPVLPAIRDGWRYVRHHPVVGPGALTASACNFACGGFLALTPVFLIRTTHASSALVGVLIATEGAGALIGAALCPRLSTRLGSGHTLLLVSVVGSAASLLMPMATHGWGWLLFAAGNAGFAGATVILSILLRAHRQETVPPALLSRVMATVRFVSWGQIPLGALLAGAIAAATSPRTSLWVFAGLTVLEPTIVWTSRIGRFRDLSEAGRGLGRLGTLRP